VERAGWLRGPVGGAAKGGRRWQLGSAECRPGEAEPGWAMANSVRGRGEVRQQWVASAGEVVQGPSVGQVASGGEAVQGPVVGQVASGGEVTGLGHRSAREAAKAGGRRLGRHPGGIGQGDDRARAVACQAYAAASEVADGARVRRRWWLGRAEPGS
jgi:hypothetical protein